MNKPYEPKDAFFRKAKQAGFRARSAFKLEELVDRHQLLRSGARVLDLGAAPGGFLQVIAQRVGAKGFVLGIDRVAIQPFQQTNVRTAVLDVLDETFPAQLDALSAEPFDLVVSDMAPKTTGIRSTDEARSMNLAEIALYTAARRGKPGSHFATKLFMGGDFEGYRKLLRERYAEVKVVRPQATRSASMEVYLVGKGLKPA